MDSRWSNFFDQSAGCSSMGYTAACHAPMSPDAYLDAVNRSFFGDKYYDLPGNNNEIERIERLYVRDVYAIFAEQRAAQKTKPKTRPTLHKRGEIAKQATRQRRAAGQGNEGPTQQPYSPFSDEFARNMLGFLFALAGNGHDANEAQKAGADDAVIICQAYKESRFKFGAAAGSHRGYLQMGPTAAQDLGITRDEYESAINDPTESIRISTRYLAKRIVDAGADLKAGLNHYGTGSGYADSILRCADKLRNSKTLGEIYNALIENGKP